MTRSPHRVTSTSTRPAARAAAAICAAVIAAPGRSPNTLRWARPAPSSAGLLGHRSVENRVSVHDFHATILHLLGLNHKRLTFEHNGRDERPTINGGRVITQAIA